jgi:hypothetical protein
MQSATMSRPVDISQFCSSIEWTTELFDQPGKLSLSCVEDSGYRVDEGAKIAVLIDGDGLFTGRVFKRERDESRQIKITAYDQLRYLQYKDFANLSAMTSSEIFEKICSEQGLTYKVVHPSAYKTAARVHDGKSYYEMIADALDDTLANNIQLFFLRDNFGVLEHVNAEKMITNLIIGEKSLLTGYTYESSIDGETANVVKISQENETTQKRDVYIAQDSDTIAKWGKLQYFETVDEKYNYAQIVARAQAMLYIHNRPERTLKLSCVGDRRIRAGNGLTLALAALRDEGLPYLKSALVSSCTHKFEGDKHTMDLTMLIV